MSVFYDFLAPLIAPVVLIRAYQDAPTPARPFATYRLTRAADPRHAVTTDPDASGNTIVRSHRAVGVEVAFYGPGAEGLANKLPLTLKRETVIQRAEALGIAVATIQPVLHAPALLDAQRWEDRGIVEFTTYVLAEVADAPGLIEQAVIEREAYLDALPTPGVPAEPAATDPSYIITVTDPDGTLAP